MRFDDDSVANHNAVCSSTSRASWWPDSTSDHWGNGLRIWLK